MRRADKKFLNDLMKQVRFPQKVKVQEPCHKAYVLLLSAVDKTEIPEFSLRVEQSEIVEQCVRILSAAFDNALERGKGTLLESCILLKRALMLQMWDDIGSNRSIFELCPQLPSALLPRFLECGINTIDNFEAHQLSELHNILRCSIHDLRNIQTFAKKVKNSKVTLEVVSIQDTQIHLRIQPSLMENQDPNEINQPRIYHLICYDSAGFLILHRRIHSPSRAVDYQISPLRPVENQSLWWSLLCEDMVGVDDKITPTSYSTPQIQNRVRRVTTYPLSVSRNLEQDYPTLSPQNQVAEPKVKKKDSAQTTLQSSFFKDKKSSKKSRGIKPEVLTGFGIFQYRENDTPVDILSQSSTKTSQRLIPTSMEIPSQHNSSVEEKFYESNEMKLLKLKGRELGRSYSPIKNIRSRVIHPPVASRLPKIGQSPLPERFSPPRSPEVPFVSNSMREETPPPRRNLNPIQPPSKLLKEKPPSEDLFDRGFF